MIAQHESDDFDPVSVATAKVDPEIFANAFQNLLDQVEDGEKNPDTVVAATLAYVEAYPEQFENAETDRTLSSATLINIWAIAARISALAKLEESGKVRLTQKHGKATDESFGALCDTAACARLQFDADMVPGFQLLDFLGKHAAARRAWGLDK